MQDSSTLYRACGSHDAEQQTTGYQQLWEYLYRVAYQVVRDQEEAPDMAEDCTQKALIKIHDRLDDCRDPKAFKAWSRRIVSHIAIDELRRRKRLDFSLDDDNRHTDYEDNAATPEEVVAQSADQQAVLTLLRDAPISARSSRVVLGRYFQNKTDEELAAVESELAGKQVLPSHVQVTRAKNIKKLKQWMPLLAHWGAA